MTDLGTIVVWLACGLICYAIAIKKGKDKLIAAALGVVFGIFAVIGYLLAKGSKEYQQQRLLEKLAKVK
jgi:cell division protein FtsW (lipid II flippase)